jgi:hypothetical protein
VPADNNDNNDNNSIKKPGPAVAPAPRTTDRRTGIDRRRVDLGPPKGIERRRSVEPRKPDVQEVDLTASDWANFDALNPIKPKTPPSGGT